MDRTSGLARIVRKRYWREADAKVVVTAWQRSRKPLGRFARDHEVDPRRLLRWSTRLQTEAEGESLRFHPVRVVSTLPERWHEPMEVVLVDGRSVRVPAGFATEDLRRILIVLEGRDEC